MAVDVLKMSDSDLDAHFALVRQEVESRKERRLDEARRQILEIANASGLDLATITKGGRKKVGKAIYQNPDVPSENWTGRGRKPAWLIAALGSGREIKDFLVP